MIKLAIIISFIFFSIVNFDSHAAVSSNQVINGLLKDIKVAQRKLVSSQKTLNKVRSKLAEKVRVQEQKVIKLRDQAAVSQRLQDEKTLSLQQLQARLKSWNEQNQYQQNILSRFNHNISKQPFSAQVPATEKLAWLSEHLATINHKMVPTWQTKRIVMPTGELQSAKILALGPVTWYVDNLANNAGFVTLIESEDPTAANLYKAELTLSSQDSAGLIELMNTGAGMISFDPTLTRAFQINGQKESLIDHIGKGGIWIFPIVFFGIFALIIALAKTIQFVRLPKLIPAFNERFAQLEKITKADDKASAIQALLVQAKGMQAQLVEIARHCDIGQKRDDRLFANLLSNKHKLDYWLGAIAITAAVSPLLGLLGTVSGMIETFKLMTLFGAGDPAAVSGGISQALVTTELGLVVAIPALLLHALLSRRVKTYYGELESCGVNLSQLEIEQ
ncbi:MAG: MotA/TolQ/ExbB proton channel family protein [Gammaproteobacteria bacterium]|nr:MotA/TolQ/ExbB proton channel family protein [Gammaproteobacteria bacterium]